jgi:hypothetical protein
MLSTKDEKRIDEQVKNYRNGLLRALHIPDYLADRYAARYKASLYAMTQNEHKPLRVLRHNPKQ